MEMGGPSLGSWCQSEPSPVLPPGEAAGGPLCRVPARLAFSLPEGAAPGPEARGPRVGRQEHLAQGLPLPWPWYGVRDSPRAHLGSLRGRGWEEGTGWNVEVLRHSAAGGLGDLELSSGGWENGPVAGTLEHGRALEPQSLCGDACSLLPDPWNF